MKKNECIIPTMRVKELRHRTHLLSGSPVTNRYFRSVNSESTLNEDDDVELGGAGVWEAR